MPIDPLAGILARLVARLGAMDGEPRTLQGGMTNRNVCVSFAGTQVVVRLCGKRTAALGIDRVTEELATRQAARLGIGPAVVTRLQDEDVLVCVHLPGRPLTGEQLREPDRLVRVAGALRAFHESPSLPTRFAVVALCHRQAAAAPAQAADLNGVLALASRIDTALAGHREHVPVPCHNDLLAANFIEHDGTLSLLDWEYAGMNDRFFDLANLAANNELTPADQQVLLDAYFGADGGATQRRRAALALMLIVSDLREALWGITQRTLSDLDVDYGRYAGDHLARLRRRLASGDIEEWITLAQTP
ncbi:MAG: phosphotransferase [Solirubrobacterales bacterium]|nr:phosphotransferase [Solirubrobacterales bacterium]